MTDNIVITPAAQRLLDKRGTNELTISLTLTSHGWKGISFKPTVSVGKPNSDGYDKYLIDDYQVYMFKNAEINNPVVIDASKNSFFRRLKVSGIVA